VAPTRGPEVEPHLAALARLEGELEVVDAAAPVGDDVSGLLEAMGYVAGDPHAAAGDVDPRDVIALLPVTWEVRRRVAVGDLAGARAGLARLEGELAGTAVLEQIEVDLLVAEGAVEEAASRSLGQAALRDTAEAWRRAGEVAMQAGWLREARDAFVLALDAVPTDARSMVGLVRATVLLDGADAAGPLTDAFLQVFPTLDELHLVAAERDLAALQLADARRHVDAVLGRAPLDVWALHLDARVSWALGEPERAIERLVDARRELPRALDVRLLLTSYLIDVGRVAEALRTIRPAAAELPDDPDVVAALARAEAAWAAQRRR
jgi:predicted Zn-dependent protease